MALVDSRRGPTGESLTPEALMRWIVYSLYLDEAIPRGWLLQWYYQLLTSVKLNHFQMVNLIESTPGVYMDPPVSKKVPVKKFSFRAVLEEPPPGFRGFVQEDGVFGEDLVSAEIWDEAQKLLSRGGWPKSEDPVFKYITVACWMQDQSEVMSELTFGRLLHMINICLHQKFTLGHRDGLLVPYEESEEYERIANAANGRPTGVQPNEDFVRDWDDLRDCLRRLILESPIGEIEVSQVKLLCRSRLRKELSETVFGHCTLSKLLDDPTLGPKFAKRGTPTSKLRLALAEVPKHRSETQSSPASGRGKQNLRVSEEAKQADDTAELWRRDEADPLQDPDVDPWSASKSEASRPAGKSHAKRSTRARPKGGAPARPEFQ